MAEPTDSLAGSAVEAAGRAKEAAGATKELAGANKEPAGGNKELAGANKEPAGATKEPTGATKESAGAAKEPAGAEKESAGAAKEPAGAEQEPAGAEKEPADAEKGPAGPEKGPAGAEKEAAGGEKGPAGGEKGPAGGAKGPAGCVKAEGGKFEEASGDALFGDAEAVDFFSFDADLTELEGRGSEIDDGEAVGGGVVFLREGGVVCAVGFFQAFDGFFEGDLVEAGAAAAADDVDDSLGGGVGGAVVGLVENEVAVDAATRIALGRVGREFKRFAALVVVDVSGENDVDAAFFEGRLEEAHALLGVVFFGGVKSGLMKADELPRLFGGGEVAFDPRDQALDLFNSVAVGVDDDEMGGAVIEGVIAHGGVFGTGDGFEGGGEFLVFE